MTNPTTHLERIAALLRKAESTDSEHEAEALVAKAQQLSTMHAIDLATARSYVPTHERREQPIVKQISVGIAGTHGLSTYVNLFVGIARANDLKTDMARNSRYVILFGMPSDVEVAEALYSSLVVQMVNACNAWLKTGEYKNEKRWSDSTFSYRPIRANTARISFQENFAYEVGRRLHAAKVEAMAERKAQERAAGTTSSDHSMALVLASKKDEIAVFYREKSTARGSWKGSTVGSASSLSRQAGRSAGQQARLSAPKGVGGSRGALAR